MIYDHADHGLGLPRSANLLLPARQGNMQQEVPLKAQSICSPIELSGTEKKGKLAEGPSFCPGRVLRRKPYPVSWPKGVYLTLAVPQPLTLE
jgi:hypothetical protein